MTRSRAAAPNVRHNSHCHLSASSNDSLPRNSVDHWLNTAIRRHGVASMQEGYVMCLVERVCVQVSLSYNPNCFSLTTVQAPENDSNCINPPTYTLYISARGLYGTEGPHFFRQSPIAVLDHFVGNQYARNAPRWTQWTRSSAIFKYRTTSFARLFLHIATSKANLDEVTSF
jgi:hypothetical protein